MNLHLLLCIYIHKAFLQLLVWSTLRALIRLLWIHTILRSCAHRLSEILLPWIEIGLGLSFWNLTWWHTIKIKWIRKAWLMMTLRWLLGVIRSTILADILGEFVHETQWRVFLNNFAVSMGLFFLHVICFMIGAIFRYVCRGGQVWMQVLLHLLFLHLLMFESLQMRLIYIIIILVFGIGWWRARRYWGRINTLEMSDIIGMEHSFNHGASIRCKLLTLVR